jgi:hypothetical protein
MTPPELPLGKYRHFKGSEYEVIGLARHSETQEWYVIYKPLYDPDSGLWIRPLSMFSESVTRDGVTQPRFTRVEDLA